jgi:hypothetical protein
MLFFFLSNLPFYIRELKELHVFSFCFVLVLVRVQIDVSQIKAFLSEF